MTPSPTKRVRTKQKSLHWLDYFSTEVTEAFDSLQNVMNTLERVRSEASFKIGQSIFKNGSHILLV